ncbi:MAG TPA: helix-turn-helix transcriptional regulator [Woeseiaceae bacterium]|nr:helix-turn-helix transcriptional regulator [Woeseiaceae bacterium]
MEARTAAQHFGEIIQRLRISAGMSQETLAAEAECHPTYISLLERGRRNPSLNTMIRLGRALNRPAWKLVRETEARL